MSEGKKILFRDGDSRDENSIKILNRGRERKTGMEIEKIDLRGKDELKICPVCGYNDGFHVMFKKAKGDTFEIKLICPSCHKLFDIAWQNRLNVEG